MTEVETVTAEYIDEILSLFGSEPVLTVRLDPPADNSSVEEQWRPVDGFPGYQVSNLGNLIGRKGRPMKIRVNTGKYSRVIMYVEGKSRMMYVSRLVATAFCTKTSDEQIQVDHINREPSDNRAANLRWATVSENMRNKSRPETSGRARAIDQLTFAGEFIKTWPSIAAAAKGAHVARTTVEQALNGKRRSRQFSWRYHVDDDLPGEMWRSFRRNGRTHTVSNLGRVDNEGHKFYGGRNSNGYMTHFGTGVHILVATAFLPNPGGIPIVNHLDGDRTNNRLHNLEWTTHSGNTRHAVELGLIPKRPVRQLTLTGEVVAVFPSVAEAARQVRLGASHIGAVCRGEKGRRTIGGYRWELVPPRKS